MLFTVLQHLARLKRRSAEQAMHARKVLAPHIRCQHLSLYWHSVAIDPTTNAAWALAELGPQVAKLLALHSARFRAAQPLMLQRLLPGAPPSWSLGPRISRHVSSVSVTCDLSISALREAAQSCVADGRVIYMQSHSTAPLGGLSFQVVSSCRPGADGIGCTVSIGTQCSNVNNTVCPTFRFKLVSTGHRVTGSNKVGEFAAFAHDFFMLGEMAGGWDAVAVAAKGLPASGELPITLTVSEVSHMQRAPAQAQAPMGQRRQ